MAIIVVVVVVVIVVVDIVIINNKSACLISLTIGFAVVEIYVQGLIPVGSETLHHQERNDRVGQVLLWVFHRLHTVLLQVFR